MDNKSQALAAVRRSARAAEKRLNATEAEMRFASDIAAGIYTADMIPVVMDADKIMELADCYIAVNALKTSSPTDRPQERYLMETEDGTLVSVPADRLDAWNEAQEHPRPLNKAEQQIKDRILHDLYGPKPSSFIPSEEEIQDMTDRLRAASTSTSKSETPTNATTSFPPKKSVPIWRKIKPWILSICVLIFFILLCVYIYNPDILSLDAPSQTEAIEPSSNTTDYEADYVGSINSDVVHRSTCTYAQNILDQNRVYYESIDDALRDGRTRCAVCLYNASVTSSTSSSGSGGLFSITPPENGKIIKDTQKEKLAPLTINTSGSSDYYIALKCIDIPGTHFSTALEREYINLKYNLTFYVAGGETAEILVPLAEYEIYYAVGDTWYGSIKKFGANTRYYQCEDTFLFEEQWDDEGMYYSGWTLTLYAVPNGNMDSEEISASEFPA